MKLHNKSEFYGEIFSLSYTDLFFPLFFLSSSDRKNLIDFQKIETNLSLVIIFQTEFYTLRGPSLWEKKRIVEQSQLIHFLTYGQSQRQKH